MLMGYDPVGLFDRNYFEGGLSNYRGYLRDHRFPRVADALVKVFGLRGKKVLDCGCAIPYLVDELLKRGVFAVGFDISMYVFGKVVEEGLQNFLLADALYIPFRDRSFYLVVASELVEHVPHELEDALLDELTRVADIYLLVRTPYWRNPRDGDRTHINIHPHMYWITKIEERGFIHDDELFEEYSKIGHREFPLFFDEFLIFRRLE